MKRFLNSVLCMCIAVFCTHAQKKNVTSVLEVMDITTGQRSVVKEFPFLIEAPNWTPDGNWLVYNSGGKLYKLSPESPGISYSTSPSSHIMISPFEPLAKSFSKMVSLISEVLPLSMNPVNKYTGISSAILLVPF